MNEHIGRAIALMVSAALVYFPFVDIVVPIFK